MGPCYSLREFHNFLNFLSGGPHHQQPTLSTKQWFLLKLWWASPRSWWTNLWKKEKPWNFGLLQYRTTPISSTLPSPLEMLTGRKPCLNLPQVPSSIGHNMDTSRIHKELLRRQPTTSTSTGTTELEPGQPVFVKEVHGNVWRTATIDQPAAEPDSYWVRFPEHSILRRTRSMIKNKVFTFSFCASGGSTTEELWRRNQFTFSYILQPVEWTVNVACHAYNKCDHTSKPSIGTAKSVHPILSQGRPVPPVTGEPPPVLRWLHQDVQHDPPKVFLQFATPHPESDRWCVSDILCVQVMQWC